MSFKKGDLIQVGHHIFRFLSYDKIWDICFICDPIQYKEYHLQHRTIPDFEMLMTCKIYNTDLPDDTHFKLYGATVTMVTPIVIEIAPKLKQLLYE
jgi:hypothetical protein